MKRERLILSLTDNIKEAQRTLNAYWDWKIVGSYGDPKDFMVIMEREIE